MAEARRDVALMRSSADTQAADRELPVTLVTYGTVQASPVGSTGSAWDLAKNLHEAGRLESVICTGFSANTDPIPADRFVTPARSLQRGIFRVIDRIESLLGRELRSLRESIFDQFVAHSAALHRARIVVFRKPNFLVTARALRRRGTPSYAIASIHHPRLNHDRVVAELERWGLHDHSLYTDLRRVERVARFFEACDHVLTMSAVGRQSFLAHGIASNRVIDAHALIGADCTRFHPRESERTWQGLRVLHLSNMNAIKGLGILFEAWTRIDSCEASLLLAGPMDETTRRLFEKIAPAHCVLLGPVSDTAGCYRDADVFVCPSLSDSNPNAALEAMASGLPLIISDACGASVLVESGVNGFVYRYDDPGALAEHLSWCSRNPQLLPEMARAARRTALANQRDRFSEAVLRAIDGSLSSRTDSGSIAREHR